MATERAPGAAGPSPIILDPGIASAGSWADRVQRAAYWLICDRDWRHTSYWRAQLEYCEQMFLREQVEQACGPNVPRDVAERRAKLAPQNLGRFVLTGFQTADRRPYRGGVTIPGA